MPFVGKQGVKGVTPRNGKNCTLSRGAKTKPAFKTDFASWSSVQAWPKTKNFGPCLWLRQNLLKSPSFEGFTTGRFLPPQFQPLTYDLFRSEECPHAERLSGTGRSGKRSVRRTSGGDLSVVYWFTDPTPAPAGGLNGEPKG